MRAAAAVGAVGDSTAGSNPSRAARPRGRSRQLRDPGAPAGLGAPDPAGLGRVGGVGAHPLGQRGEQPGEQRVGGRVEAERRARRRAGSRGAAGARRCPGAPASTSTRPASRSRSRCRRTVLACMPSALGELLGRERGGRRASSRYIAYRVSSPRALSTASWSDRAVHGLTVPGAGHIFKIVACIYSV